MVACHAHHVIFGQCGRFAANDRQPWRGRGGRTLHRSVGAVSRDGAGGGEDAAEGWTLVLTINVALLLIIIVVLRLRRRTQARSRLDEQMTVVIVLALGVLLAPTQFGHGVVHFMSELGQSVSQIRI
jgi:hypothetical protein